MVVSGITVAVVAALLFLLASSLFGIAKLVGRMQPASENRRSWPCSLLKFAGIAEALMLWLGFCE